MMKLNPSKPEAMRMLRSQVDRLTKRKEEIEMTVQDLVDKINAMSVSDACCELDKEIKYVDESEGVEEEMKSDMINNPSHYTSRGMECIDEMVIAFGKNAVFNFCICNAWKYRYRAGLKNNAEEDQKKADWYMNKAKELQQADAINLRNAIADMFEQEEEEE